MRSLHLEILNSHSIVYTIHVMNLAIVTLGTIDTAVTVITMIPAVNMVHASYG
jgi:hypothetical protein